MINYGPGLSAMTKVSAYVDVQMQKDSEKSNIWLYKKMIIAEGPDEIKLNEERSYRINGFFILTRSYTQPLHIFLEITTEFTLRFLG